MICFRKNGDNIIFLFKHFMVNECLYYEEYDREEIQKIYNELSRILHKSDAARVLSKKEQYFVDNHETIQ